MGEHQKAKYRLVAFVLIAVLGFPIFGSNRFLAAVYSILLILYSMWALRLTVVFARDPSLGYLLCFIDVVMLAPLILRGGTVLRGALLSSLWLAGLYASHYSRVCERRKALRQAAIGQKKAPARMHAGSEIGAPKPVIGEFYGLVATFRQQIKSEPTAPFLLLVMEVHRYEELLVLSGEAVAQRALVALTRRAVRAFAEAFSWTGDSVFAPGPIGYRIDSGRVAFMARFDHGCPGVGPSDLDAVAARVGRVVSARLVDGRKMEVSFSWARFPQDGASLEELITAAQRTAAALPYIGAAQAARSQLAITS